MRSVWFPLIFLALAGCSTTKTVEVKVPVTVPCVLEEVEEPVYPTADQEAGLFERVKVLLAELELRKGYEERLRATISGCRAVD